MAVCAKKYGMDIDYLLLEVPKISAIKASWRTFEKFKPRSKPALLSHAGIVRVFLTEISKCNFA